jgi:drug/metabolite transporter (DMT)-like permease
VARSFLPSSAVLWIAFICLAFIWGSSFLFIKIGLEEGLAPLTLVTYRLAIATVFLVLVLRLTNGRLPDDRSDLARLGFLGVINIVIPFAFITWGEQYISSALASILNGLVPLFTIVLASLALRDEPITLNRLGGLLIGFAGAVLLLSPGLTAESFTGDQLVLAGELALVAASLSYAFSAVYVRRFISGRRLVVDPVTGPRTLTPVESALPQSVVGLAVILASAVLFEPPAGGGVIAMPPTGAAWFAVSWLGILGSGVAYLLFFRIISAWDATRAALVTYVMPIVGIALGVAVLGERLHLAELLGAALVIGGLVLANSRVGQRRLFGRTSAPAGASPE